jgi:hemoglobin
MRRLTYGIAVLLFMASAYRASATDALFAELGGQPGIERIASNALDIYFTDPRLAHDFDNINRDFLQPRFTAYLCRIAGGPCIYKGHSMKRAHKGLAIDEARFNAVVEDLETAMDRAGVPYHVQNRFLARLAPLERAIVTR